jgi:hypothetical protein
VAKKGPLIEIVAGTTSLMTNKRVSRHDFFDFLRVLQSDLARFAFTKEQHFGFEAAA